MEISDKNKIIAASITGFIIFLAIVLSPKGKPKDPYIGNMTEEEIDKSIPAIQVYYYIKKYSKEYGIPEKYAFGVAYQETRYQGPLDSSYNHKQTSSSGAVGPMQIIPRYAHKHAGRKVTGRELRNDIKLNVKVSMSMLKDWHEIHENWGLAFGAYNTGSPCVNGYAREILNCNYNWIKNK
jgi:soluble lytic murein transglycosylase-like protein